MFRSSSRPPRIHIRVIKCLVVLLRRGRSRSLPFLPSSCGIMFEYGFQIDAISSQSTVVLSVHAVFSTHWDRLRSSYGTRL
ncbi:hypothetical protein BV25DRAFT_1253091 [Artomyces pyxidatus]|uniref:Uncharacterized protein n=1 Tax=Artomyces pyxidatus TaxID=48021 RepID=A0ACB8TEJ3_9AGAM|nr:hypothetical protein BV25DRAFT_1253091 [Artomyces pyxidatus]